MTKLQPACLDSACSMWSRNPMPVCRMMVCDLLVCAACPPAALLRTRSFTRSSVSGGKSPPSRLSASWMDVSLVSRARAAHRGVGEEEAIL